MKQRNIENSIAISVVKIKKSQNDSLVHFSKSLNPGEITQKLKTVF